MVTPLSTLLESSPSGSTPDKTDNFGVYPGTFNLNGEAHIFFVSSPQRPVYLDFVISRPSHELTEKVDREEEISADQCRGPAVPN